VLLILVVSAVAMFFIAGSLPGHIDGGITLHVQNESPGADKESNWLPAPKGSFFAALRLYRPKPEAR